MKRQSITLFFHLLILHKKQHVQQDVPPDRPKNGLPGELIDKPVACMVRRVYRDKMTDFHNNIFYYYRGAKQHGQRQEQQLEDNTTKALINMLQHCDPAVAAEYLKSLGITIANDNTVEFELQKPTIGHEKIHCRTQRLLLAIAGTQTRNASICTKLVGPFEGDSRPDAWIYGKDFVVLLESKVGDSALELNQMRCHWRKLQRNIQSPPCCKISTWAEVHQFFANHLPILLPNLKGKDKWLVEQFTQYLEWIGMTEFVGFEESVFEFFVHEEKDPRVKQWMRDAMRALAKQVLYSDHGLKAFDGYYTDYHVGKFGEKDDHFWVAFGPPKFRGLAHQTVSLYDYGLDVFVNVELLPAVKKLRKKIKGSESTFRKVISELPSPFTVQIQERKANRPRVFDYYTVAELEAGVHDRVPYGLKDPQSQGFDYVCTLLSQIQYPYLSVRRRINRKQVVELSKGGGKALVDEIVEITKAFHSLVQFVNE